MNHTYRLVWNEAAQREVPAAEAVPSRGKSGGCRALKPLRTIILAAAFGATYVGSTLAAPTGGTVVAGQGTISQTGGTTTVTQHSQNLALNWLGFSISPTETVQFVQPSTTAIALNRVIGTDASQIYGHLVANGQVFLINPNGVLFAPGAQVDVGSLVASSLNISNADFLAGNYKFQTGSSTSAGAASAASVINQGSITAAAGGSVALLGGQVSNQGTITARLGTVALAAGSAMTLDFHGNKLMSVQVDRGAVGALAENRQLIQADGGTVIMTAAARDALLNTVVNNTGVIEARTIQDQDGEIKLLGSPNGGTVNVGGTLDASAPNGGNGGSIETSGAHVEIADTAHITTTAGNGKTGTWLVDPTDFTIAPTGGDISGATLSGELASTSVTLASSNGSVSGNGDIFVNDAVSWGANTTLTLTATRNIQINGTITASGNTAGLALNYGAGSNYYVNTGGKVTLSGTTPSFSVNGQAYTVINSLGVQGDTTSTTLQGIQNNLSGFYVLGTDIDATATSGWNSGAGFAPLGNFSAAFTGVFDGLNNTITGLTINRPSHPYVGLFSNNSGTIRNIGLSGGSVTGSVDVGALVGDNTGTVYNSYATASVSSTSSQVGGLVGETDGGSISNSYATGTVSGTNYVGGLVGYMPVGGAISDSYAGGNVTATGFDDGGLVGYMSTNSVAYPSVTNSYATGTVAGTIAVGGLVGALVNGSVANSYSIGAVTGTASLGGLVGSSSSGTTVTTSFWNTTTSGLSTSAGGTGMTTAQMEALADFTSATAANGNVNPAWDFTSVWRIYDGYTAPLLKALLTPLTVSADNFPATYTGTTSSATLENPVYSVAGADTSGHLQGLTTPYANDRNVGTYSPVLWSDQQGYDITVKNGTLTITPAVLTVSGATAANKVYDGTVGATVSGGALSGVLGTDAVGFTEAGAFSDKNVANGKTVTETFGLTGSDAANYTLASNTATTTANITPATLTVGGASAADKVYDGTASATISGGALSGVLGADAVTLIQAGAFSDKNVANNKTVTETFGLTGGDAGNYTLSSNTATTNASITPATLTVSGATAANKVYDGTVTATVSGGALSGVLGTDAVTLTEAGTFSDKNVANNKTVTETFDLTGGDASNYTLTSNTANTTANITPATVTVSGASAANKVYDGTVGATVSGGALSGVFGTDAVTLTQGGAFSDKNVANNKTVTETFGLTGGDAGNYTLSSNTATTTASITPATLTVSGASAADKVYDGTASATISGGALSGVLGTDAVSLTEAGAFSDKNVANNKTVTETFGLMGGDAGNYTLSSNTATTTASITPATLTVSGASAANKVYDGTASATISGGALSGVLGTDAVSLTEAGAFSDKNVANNKTVAETFGLTGGDAGNYTLSSNTASTTANITPATLTVSGATAADKVYDGTAGATVSGGALSGVFGTDAVTLTQGGAFSDKNVANNKTVTETFGLTGGDAANYTLTSNTATTTASITPATLTVSGATAANKVYDGTVTATVGGGALTGVLGTDAVALTEAGAFSDKNVANNKTVTETFGLTGGDSGNYVLSSNTASTTASITPAALTVSGATAANKVYDGTVTATVGGGALTGVLGTDAVTLTEAGAFSDKNVANNKTVTETFGLTGGDAGNYALSSNTATTTASITPATLTVSGATAANKVYDGTVAATVGGGALSGVLGTDTVSLTEAGAFSDKNVANNKTVTETFGLTGGDASNYTLASNTATTTANITPAALTVSGATAASKTYDGSLDAAISGGVLSGVFGSDSVGLLQSGSFSDRNAGTNKTVTESFGLTGSDSGNYLLANGTAQTTANITPKMLTVSANAQTKTYGQADPTLSYTSSGYVSGTFNGVTVNDTASSVLTGTLTRVAGETVHGGPYAIDQGSLAPNGNYTISYTSNFLIITPATITLSGITANDKPYDATTAATLNTAAAAFAGRIGGDSLGVTATGAFVDPNAGTGKTVTLSNLALTGAASGNYVLAASGNESSTTANITPDSLTITADNATKATGATNPAFTLTYSGFVGGESAAALTTPPTVSTTASTTSPAGNYSITASGAVDPNYTFTYVPGTLTVLSDAATSSQSYTGTLAGLSNVGTNGTSGSGSGVGEGEAHGAALDCSGYVYCVEIPANLADNDGEDLRGKSRGALSLWSLIILDGGINLPLDVH